MHTKKTSLIAELEQAVSKGSSERRLEMLRHVTELFLADCDQLNAQQVAVFDNVLVHLVEQIESRALEQLSVSLSPLENAPLEVIRRLARDEEIAVAGPVLTRSPRLTEQDLIEVAETRSQEHLLAISGRRTLDQSLTDVLARRGDHRVAHALADNAGARFSESGFAELVQKADADGERPGEVSLAEKLGLRADIPDHLLRRLLLRASEMVRKRLLAVAPAHLQEDIRAAISSTSGIRGISSRPPPRGTEFASPENAVLALHRQGKLNDSAVFGFAAEGKHDEVVFSLHLMCAAKVETIEMLMDNERTEGIVIACKAADLRWETAAMILKMRARFAPISDIAFAEARASFHALSMQVAQRTMRFWQARNAVRKTA